MRALKIILVIVISIAVLLAILGSVGPSTYRIERSTVIGAPSELVFGYVSRLSSMKDWGPWQEMDRDQVQSIEGTDGTVGAVWRWEGDTVGKGSQTIIALEPGKSVRTELQFIEPFASTSQASYDLEAMGDSTRVTWGMEGTNDFMGKLMSKFMDMDQMIGPDFDKGLANLKALAEGDVAARKAALAAKTFGGYPINTILWPGGVVMGKRAKNVKFADIPRFYGASFGVVQTAIKAAGMEISSQPSGIYFDWDEKKGTADLMAGFQVKTEADARVPGLETLIIPSCRMLHIAYYGAYEKIGSAHEAMDGMVEAKGFTHFGNVIEEYVTDPMAEPDTSKWLTNLYYMVK